MNVIRQQLGRATAREVRGQISDDFDMMWRQVQTAQATPSGMNQTEHEKTAALTKQRDELAAAVAKTISTRWSVRDLWRITSL